MRTPVSTWVAGARPRTLPAAVVPVLVGTAVAYYQHGECWGRAVLALVVSLSMQIGVNYANDYSDGIRGTDDDRIGPERLVGGGLALPGAVKRAAFASFGVGGAAGLALSILAAPWLIAVGAACVAAGWFYTGGSKPYGYSGFGELAVFVFFGLVATVGTAYVQEERMTSLELVAALPVGFLAVALLVVNNLRDLENDAAVGKRTLAVRLGDRATRGLYVACLGVPFVAAGAAAVGYGAAWIWLGCAAIPLAVRPAAAVLRESRGTALVGVLGATGRLQGAFGILLAAGLVLARP